MGARPSGTGMLAVDSAGSAGATRNDNRANTAPAKIRKVTATVILLLCVALDEDRLVTVHRSFGAANFHDLGEIIDRGLAETGLGIAAGIVLLLHQHVHGAALGKQPDGLTI